MPRKPDISILIVYYNETKELFECLASIKSAKLNASFEAIIVDNSLSQNLEEKLKKYTWVKYIKAPKNLGFGGGINLAVKHAGGKYIFTLNPDAKIFPDTLERLLNFIEKKKGKVAAAPTLVNSKGNTLPFVGTRTLIPVRGIFGLSFINKLFPKNPISKSYLINASDKKSAYEADVIPGIFLMKKEDFGKIGGFDEHFFLYFEDTDLCKRLKERGFSLFVLPESKVMHTGGTATSKDRNINKVFAKSRFYYFRKHYGIVNALMVEAFARFSKWHAAFLAILCLAAFLRLWQTGTLMQFIGDIGWYYLSARDFLLNGKIPLLGIPSSVPVLRQGAIFTWMLAGAFLLGDFNPVSGAYLTAFLGLLAVWGTYKIASNWFGNRIGLISAALAATSPFIVVHDRMPFVTAGIFPLTVLIAWLAERSIGKHSFAPFFLGFFTAVLYQFELAGFILLPIVAATLLWQKVKPKWQSILRFALGGTFGLAPFIISDIREGTYLQTVGFAFWLIRKSARGIFSFFKGGADLQIFAPGLEFLTDFTFPQSTVVALIIFISATALFVSLLIREKGRQVFANKLIAVWLFLASAGFFLKGVFSEAYMPIIFFPTLVLLAFLFDFLIAKFRYLGWAILFMIIAVNSLYVVKVSFNRENMYSISKMNEVAKYIIAKAKGRSYQLVYIGPSDMYESGDNAWRYLLWKAGNEPEIRSNLVYTISYEHISNVGSFDKTINFESITVGTKQK